MNKDLMMKAAIQFKGVWPDQEETHLYKFHYGRFVTGMAGGTADVVCTREQFEDFVESLFDGAPEGATHVDCENTKRYYRHDGREYHLISKLNPVRCANFDKLIPRPVKKLFIGDTPEQLKEGVTPKAPYMPKVGEECEVSIDDGARWYKFVKTDKRNLILDESWGEMLDGLYLKFRPLRTERELFIEQAAKDYLDQVGSDAVNPKWFERIFGALYDAGYTKGGAK